MIDQQAFRTEAFTRIEPSGIRAHQTRAVAVERPVALEINGLGYAVLMATPEDLIDLAAGFALSDRLISNVHDLIDVEPFQHPDGVLLRMRLAARCYERVFARVRHRVTESSCGLCGIENLEQALRPLPRVPKTREVSDAAVFAALADLENRQPLSRQTRATHAAALCGADGAVHLVREDVGRHNAFDKLIGAMLRAGHEWEDGFALLTARCSYELVEKAALAGCATLVTISAATSLAMDRAREAGITLKTVARHDALLEPGDTVSGSRRPDEPPHVAVGQG
jgi:FdhD protein